MNRMINVRLAIKAMEELPRVLFKKGPSLDIAEAVIRKSKITLETSLIRTLLYSCETKKKEDTRLKLARGHNTFVAATPSNNYLHEQQAILTLNELFKSHLRACIGKFRLNSQATDALGRYFAKLCSNFLQSRVSAFNMIKLLPGKGKATGVDEKTLSLSRLVFILQKIEYNSSRLQFESFASIKLYEQRLKFGQKYAAKTMVLYSKIRREQVFRLWKKVAVDCRE